MAVATVPGGMRLAALSLAAMLLAGCSMGSFLGGGGDERFADVSASADQIAQGAPGLPAIATECPPIRVLAGAGSFRSYVGNRTSDPGALRYQGVIERYTRNCVASNGMITVQMGASGRVVTGPAASAGEVSMPLRFAVERDGVAIFSQLYSVPVSLAVGGDNQFSQTVEGVQIPYTGGETIVIWVGFDA